MSKSRAKNKDKQTERRGGVTIGEGASIRSPHRGPRVGRILLLLAFVVGCIVYAPAVRKNWMYDDSDYILADPRLDHPELFLPSGWKSAPPPLADEAGEELHLPAYQQPLIVDRYLWRLSFGMERWMFGPPSSATRSYVINILIHLACIAALYFTVRTLLHLYREDSAPFAEEAGENARVDEWAVLPGLATLLFAIHPWTSESVCYLSARNGSMGTFFVLLGTLSSVEAVRLDRALWMRGLGVFLALVCAVLAYGCKENMVTAIAGYLLVTVPVLARRAWRFSPAATIGGALASVAVLLGVAWLGIQSSHRAAGLLAQTGGGRGWEYFFTIQNPVLLLTLGDQFAVQRMSLETNHPLWPLWACWLALVLNAALALLGTVGGFLRAPLLGLGWFYVHLVPTNSFLPRPEFLAGRNVYLPVAGFAVFAAAVGIYLWTRTRDSKPVVRIGVRVLSAVVLLFWVTTTFLLAREYADGAAIWARSARQAPDHATVRLNHAAAILTFTPNLMSDPDALKQAETELKAALKAEESATMFYHTERPRLVRQANALRALGSVCRFQKRYDEACDYFRRSWQLLPMLHIWAEWTETALETRRNNLIEEAISAGLGKWPDAWWPQAMRGIRTAGMSNAPYPREVLDDLRRADAVPDARRDDLRGIQMKAIAVLSQVEREKAWQHIDRLKRLGAPPNDVARIEERLIKQGVTRP